MRIEKPILIENKIKKEYNELSFKEVIITKDVVYELNTVIEKPIYVE